MLRLTSAFIGLVVLVLEPVWAGTEPIVTTDLLRIRSVSAIDVSREGSRAVFAVRSIATIPAGR